MMKFNWTEKNVDLEFLRESVGSFFFMRGFLKKESSVEEAGRQIQRFSLEREGKPVIVSVRVWGSPDNFDVDFLSDQNAERMARLGLLSTLLGGGFLMRGKLENTGFLERLEGDFWDCIDETIRRKTSDAKA